MIHGVAPRRDRRLVAEEAQRQHFAGIGQALEPLDRDEAIDRLQLGLQPCGDVEIGVALSLGGLDLEDHRDHRSTLARKMRSSQRMKRSPCAKAKFLRPSGWSLSRAR